MTNVGCNPSLTSRAGTCPHKKQCRVAAQSIDSRVQPSGFKNRLCLLLSSVTLGKLFNLSVLLTDKMEIKIAPLKGDALNTVPGLTGHAYMLVSISGSQVSKTF